MELVILSNLNSSLYDKEMFRIVQITRNVDSSVDCYFKYPTLRNIYGYAYVCVSTLARNSELTL
jgi:hypothetical protein